jgi:hypothetical protein
MLHRATVGLPTGPHAIFRAMSAPDTQQDQATAPREVVVRFAKPKSIIVAAVLGYGAGELLGVDGFVGSFVGAVASTFFDSLSYISIARFNKLRATRRRGALKTRAMVPRRVAVLSSALVNLTTVAAAFGLCALLLALLSINPSDVGLAEEEVTSQRFYVTLAALGFGIGALITALAFGTMLDIAEGKFARGLLGFFAFILEFGIASQRGDYITGPDNIYTDVFGLVVVWLACFVWNPLRWARAYFYGADSRGLALVRDISQATPKTQFVSRS